MITVFAGCASQSAPAPTQTSISQKSMEMPATVPMAEAKAVPASEPVVLKFTEASITAIQAGTKTATIRKGVRTFSAATVRAVGAEDSVVMLDHVTTATKKMSELTEADAKANGSASLDDLKAQLAKDYPGIGAEDVVTVIGFKLDSGSGM